LFSWRGKAYGIDLGTSNTVICEAGKGIVLNEPSVVALDRKAGTLLAAGAEAQAMIGRAPKDVVVANPLTDGVIADYETVGLMLQAFIRKIRGRSALPRNSQVCVSVPCGITPVQKRAVENTAVFKGTNRVITVEEPLAAAVGAGLRIQEPIGHFVLDLGGGTCQAAILSLGGVVASRTLPRAGIALDRDIMDYVKKAHNLEIGERTAEEIKMRIGTALPHSESKTIDVKGRSLTDGLPRTIRLMSAEISAVAEGYVQAIIDLVRATIEQCPPELTADVIEHGILLCGGSALLCGLDERIRMEIGVPVQCADRPMECTAQGTGIMAGANSD
jgi:rod shape-determining protein MreB